MDTLECLMAQGYISYFFHIYISLVHPFLVTFLFAGFLNAEPL